MDGYTYIIEYWALQVDAEIQRQSHVSRKAARDAVRSFRSVNVPVRAYRVRDGVKEVFR
jgi:hypothetical protein